MMTQCARGVLVVLGVVLLAMAILPLTAFLPIPEQYETAFVSSKLLMLPVGALCLAGAAGLSAKLERHRRGHHNGV